MGHQPRLHRPQPLVRPLRRRRPPRLPALRPRSRSPAPTFAQVRETALVVQRGAGRAWACPATPRPPAPRASTSTCRSCAGRRQKEVWAFAKALASRWPARQPELITAEYRIAKRPAAACWSTTTRTPGAARWPRSTRCARAPRAPVSMPVTWEELEGGVAIEDFRIDNAAGAHRRSAATCGRRCSTRGGRVYLEIRVLTAGRRPRAQDTRLVINAPSTPTRARPGRARWRRPGRRSARSPRNKTIPASHRERQGQHHQHRFHQRVDQPQHQRADGQRNVQS